MRRAAIAVGMLWVGAAVAGGPDAGFVFDGAFSGTGGLGLEFVRGTPTVGMDGAPIGADEPRYAPEQHLPTPPVFETVRATSRFTGLYGSGLDHDGQTPLLVVLEDATPTDWLDVYAVPAAGVASAMPGAGITRTVLGERNDLMQNTVPERTYLPRAAVVCHGLIVVQCEVFRALDLGGGNFLWQSIAVGYVASQDRGATWQVIHEDPVTEPGNTHGREWGFQNWFPLERTSGEPPLEAWFAGADYRSITLASGGFMHLFHATRPHAQAQWTIGPVIAAFSLPFEQNRKRHMHAAGVVRKGESGLRFIGANGDGRDDNFIVSVIRDDENYTDASTWTRQEDYHGSRDPLGTYGNQFVGCAPTEDSRSLLLGTDLSVEQLMRLDCPDDADHPITRWVFGRNTASHATSLNFVLRTPTPERAGPYTVEYAPNISTTPNNASRALYSPDGRRWAIAADPSRATGFPILSDGFLYLASKANQGGVIRTPEPSLFSQRPLHVAPGGLQHVPDSPSVTLRGQGQFTALTRNAQGLWVDAGVPLDPQPPCLGQVYRVRSSDSLANAVIADIRFGGAGDIGSVAGIDTLKFRCWLLSASPNQTVFPILRLRPQGSAGGRSIDVNLNTVADWWPITAETPQALAANQRAELRVESASNAPGDVSFYLALDTLAEGPGWPGYPLPPDQTGTGTLYPDERARVVGLACTSEWTLTLAGMVPDEAWDSSAVSLTGRWPIATVWADSQNFVELIADAASGRLIAELTANGSRGITLQGPPIFWLRNSPVLVSLSHGPGGLEGSCAISGQPVTAMTPVLGSPPNAALAASPAELRFGDAAGLSGGATAVRVAPMWWFGGAVHRTSALTGAERAELLNSLSFLHPPPACPADLTTTGTTNGAPDGVVNGSDFTYYLSLFASGDPRADLTTTGSTNGVPDGVINGSDFTAYLSSFAAGCP